MITRLRQILSREVRLKALEAFTPAGQPRLPVLAFLSASSLLLREFSAMRSGGAALRRATLLAGRLDYHFIDRFIFHYVNR